MLPIRKTPYAGPRAFRVGETLYGRDWEAEELRDLLIARRIVLLYAPSGAGKTSLIQAGLIPALEKEQSHVWPIIRVNAEPPAELAAAGQAMNRYVYSTLNSLEKQWPDGMRASWADLAGLTLAEYLDRERPAMEDPTHRPDLAMEVFLFDQFEEILTVDLTDIEAKREFFEQLGVALRDPARLALFVMREDRVASLNPYLQPIPNLLGLLGTGLRIDRLSPEAARLAIQEPAREWDVEFTDRAADALIDDLRTVQVRREDGKTTPELGPHVEPVQLQVACQHLWEKKFPAPKGPDGLPPEARRIARDDIEAVGDVDSALASYYDERVAAIARSSKVSQGAIRKWFGEKLITKQGTRGLVVRGDEQSQGLDNRVIQALVDAHLVQAETRRDVTLYELIHDRFIPPILESNREQEGKKRTQLFTLAIGAMVVLGLIAVLAIGLAWQTGSGVADLEAVATQAKVTGTAVAIVQATVTEAAEQAKVTGTAVAVVQATVTEAAEQAKVTDTAVAIVQETATRAAEQVEQVDAAVVPLYFADAFSGPGRIYKLARNSVVTYYTRPEGWISHLALKPDGTVYFSYLNDRDVYKVENGQETLVYSHDTYVRDIEFDPRGRLYFSEAAGAGSDGQIYRLDGIRATAFLTVELATVNGYWAGDFAFDSDGAVWLSSGNHVPARLYQVVDQVPQRQFTDNDAPIRGFFFEPSGSLIYADGRNRIQRLTIPGFVRASIHTTDPAAISDVAPAIFVRLNDGDASTVANPPGIIAYANTDYTPPPQGVTVRDSGGLGRDNERVTLKDLGQWIQAAYREDVRGVGVQFWGGEKDGWARVRVNGIEVWKGSVYGPSAETPFTKYLEISGLTPGVHTVRVENMGRAGDGGGELVTVYFFGGVRCPFAPQGVFSDLWQQREYRERLGCPVHENAKLINDVEQAFDIGHMFWRQDNGYIYVVHEGRRTPSGPYESFKYTWSEGDPEYSCKASPLPGKVQPKRGFGAVWCTLVGTEDTIGWGLAEEASYGPGFGDPAVHDFERGFIFRDSAETVYVFFEEDGTYVRLPP